MVSSSSVVLHTVLGSSLFITEDNELTDEELEVYGVDWEALQDEQILQSAQESGQGIILWSSMIL